MPTFEPAVDDATSQALICACCIGLTTDPVELNCEHLYCLTCAFDTQTRRCRFTSCPTCRAPTTSIKKPSRILIGLSRETQVVCSDCRAVLPNADARTHVCAGGGAAGAPSSAFNAAGDEVYAILKLAQPQQQQQQHNVQQQNYDQQAPQQQAPAGDDPQRQQLRAAHAANRQAARDIRRERRDAARTSRQTIKARVVAVRDEMRGYSQQLVGLRAQVARAREQYGRHDERVRLLEHDLDQLLRLMELRRDESNAERQLMLAELRQAGRLTAEHEARLQTLETERQALQAQLAQEERTLRQLRQIQQRQAATGGNARNRTAVNSDVDDDFSAPPSPASLSSSE